VDRRLEFDSIDHDCAQVAAARRAALPLVFGCGVGMFFSIGIVLVYGFSVFIIPIASDTGWGRAQVAAVMAPIALVNGLMSPLVGILTDRFGPRRVLVVSSVATSAGLIGISQASYDYFAFVAAVTIAGILGGAQTGVPYTHVLVGRFRARRGLALGTALSFVGLGIAVVPPSLSALIASVGWRGTFMIAGMAYLIVLLPIALFVIQDPPKARLAGSTSEAPGSGGSAIWTVSFWIMLGAFTLNYLTAAAGSITLPSTLVDRGVDPASASHVMIVVGLTFTAARFGFGALLDRFPALPLTSIAFIAPAAGHLLLAGSDNVAAAYVSAIFFGLASGAEGDAMGYLLAQRFGTREFGKLYGINYFAFTLGSGLGPAILTAIAADGTRYGLAFDVFAALGLIAPGLLMIEWRRRSKEKCHSIIIQ
jgi:MFS family permease